MASEGRPNYEKLSGTHSAHKILTSRRWLCSKFFWFLCFRRPCQILPFLHPPFVKIPSVSLLGTLAFCCTSQPPFPAMGPAPILFALLLQLASLVTNFSQGGMPPATHIGVIIVTASFCQNRHRWWATRFLRSLEEFEKPPKPPKHAKGCKH